MEDDFLCWFKHDLRVIANAGGVGVDPITAVTADDGDDACSMTGISSRGNLGFGFVSNVVVIGTVAAPPFLLVYAKADGWEAENMAYTLSDSSDQWAEHNRYSKGTHTSFLSIHRPLFTNDSK